MRLNRVAMTLKLKNSTNWQLRNRLPVCSGCGIFGDLHDFGLHRAMLNGADKLMSSHFNNKYPIPIVTDKWLPIRICCGLGSRTSTDMQTKLNVRARLDNKKLVGLETLECEKEC
jgi:hypothetical protein